MTTLGNYFSPASMYAANPYGGVPAYGGMQPTNPYGFATNTGNLYGAPGFGGVRNPYPQIGGSQMYTSLFQNQLPNRNFEMFGQTAATSSQLLAATIASVGGVLPLAIGTAYATNSLPPFLNAGFNFFAAARTLDRSRGQYVPYMGGGQMNPLIPSYANTMGGAYGGGGYGFA